jgi:TetR/AcrR family tetracycline transcriptional repressor
MSNSHVSNRTAAGEAGRAVGLAVGTAGSYSRADVVETALNILDEFGLADLSMRRLAGVLNVQPSALYWHVPNKQTLLALVADQIIDRAAVVNPNDFVKAGSLDWKARTLAEATAIRDGLLAFRDGAEVVSSTLALGLGAGEALARIREGIDAICTDEEVARVAAESILFLVLGQVWHQQQRMQADSLGVVAPAVAANPEDAQAAFGVLHPQIESFEFGIGLILAGLEQKLAAVR